MVDLENRMGIWSSEEDVANFFVENRGRLINSRILLGKQSITQADKDRLNNRISNVRNYLRLMECPGSIYGILREDCYIFRDSVPVGSWVSVPFIPSETFLDVFPLDEVNFLYQCKINRKGFAARRLAETDRLLLSRFCEEFVNKSGDFIQQSEFYAGLKVDVRKQIFILKGKLHGTSFSIESDSRGRHHARYRLLKTNSS